MDIARFLTAGRVCVRRGAMAVSGWGVRDGSTKWAGKRAIRIERVESVSSSVSGGVSG